MVKGSHCRCLESFAIQIPAMRSMLATVWCLAPAFLGRTLLPAAAVEGFASDGRSGAVPFGT